MKKMSFAFALLAAGFAAGRSSWPYACPAEDRAVTAPGSPEDPFALAARLSGYARDLDRRIREESARAREADLALSMLRSRGTEESALEQLRERKRAAERRRRGLKQRRATVAELERRVRATAPKSRVRSDDREDLLRQARSRVLRDG